MATAKIQVLSDGSMRGSSFELTKEVMSLGRSESCDICIPDSTISGHHLSLLTVAGETETYFLRDEGSTNGTRYNGEKLEPEVEVELHHGDIFQAGGIELLFDSGVAMRQESHRGAGVISLEDTGSLERSTTTLRNMGSRTGVKKKGKSSIRDNHGQRTAMMALIVVFSLGVLAGLGYFLYTLFGSK